MAENKLLPFANASDANVTTYDEWSSDSLKSTVEKGFTSGIAKSARINRVLAQGAAAGYSIGELVKDYAGQDADIDASALYTGFVEALKTLSKQTVVDVVYPVGSIYIATVSTNPADLFGVGTWERIGAGRTLIDAGGSFPAGTTGGSDTHTLTVNEMPAHSHSGSTASAGSHSHTRGSMEITGSMMTDNELGGSASGAFYGYKETNGAGAENNKVGFRLNFAASRTWTGETSYNGGHTHLVTVSNTGGGQAFSVRNPYLATYIWKRTA
jgi:hypothetical protein